MRSTSSPIDRTPCPKCSYPHVHSAQEAKYQLAEKLPDYTVLDINQSLPRAINTMKRFVNF